MQATAVTQATTVTSATSNTKNDSNIMTAHNSRNQCCQITEIPAKKLKRGRRKKSWPKEFVAEFWPNFG
jgi:hypothetical protein